MARGPSVQLLRAPSELVKNWGTFDGSRTYNILTALNFSREASIVNLLVKISG